MKREAYRHPKMLDLAARLTTELPRISRHPIIAECVSERPALAFTRSIQLGLFRSLQPRDKGHCTFCNSCVPTGRWTWCSRECWDELKIYVAQSWANIIIRQRDQGKCQVCGADGEQVDHIIPVKLGGGLCSVENLWLLCGRCHLERTRELRSALRIVDVDSFIAGLGGSQ